MSNPNFVSGQWLEDHLTAPDVVVVDASWYLPHLNRNPRAEYEAGHIPGAVFFDIDAIADTASGLPHMLPAPQVFSAEMSKLGIGDGARIVIYDGLGLFSAPRIWWTFRTMGARDVVILEGGAPRWKAENRPWTDEKTTRRPTNFTARLDHGAVASLGDVKSYLAGNKGQIVDARPADRFKGDAPEPRPGLKSGHMPGAKNVPAGLVSTDGVLKPAAEIETIFKNAGVDLDKPIVTSCGSGVTAAILALALESTGRNIKALYDGSWAEWGGRDDCDVAKG